MNEKFKKQGIKKIAKELFFISLGCAIYSFALLCGIYTCCGAYRLARFNVTKMKNGYYQGVPITTCGTILAIIALFKLPSIVMLILLIVCSYLMVSNIKIKKM